MIGYREREELPDSALEIEKAQAKIRYVIKKGVTNNVPWIVLDGIIGKIIQEVKIADKELLEKAKKSLLNYGTIIYRKFSQELQGLLIVLLPAVAEILSPSSPTATQKAAGQIIRAYPKLIPGAGEITPYVEIAQPLKKFCKDYMEQVESAYSDLSTSEAKDSYSDRVSLRNVCEMTERYNQKEKELQKFIDAGEDLVYIATHANCSKRCEPWQGKLYSISGKYGTIDGISYQPLSNATDIYVTTKSGKTYKNGCVFGFNCRHPLQKYRKGAKPIHVSAEVIEKYREINDNQRAIEREIRQNKALSVGLKGIDDKAAKEYAIKAKQAYDAYTKYSKDNDVAYYPARCKVFDGEELLTPKYKRILDQYRK